MLFVKKNYEETYKKYEPPIIENIIKEFTEMHKDSKFFVLNYIINNKCFNGGVMMLSCGKVLWLYYKIDDSEKITLLEEMQKEIKKSFGYACEKMLNKSNLLILLCEIVDFEKGCKLCGKLKICFEFCYNCFPKEEYSKSVVDKLSIILHSELFWQNKKMYLDDVDFLLGTCYEKLRFFEQILFSCNDDVYVCCDFIDTEKITKKENIGVLMTIKCLVSEKIEIVKKAKHYVDIEYFKKINNFDNCYVQRDVKNMNYTVENYIIAVILKRQVSKSIDFLLNMQNIIKRYEPGKSISILLNDVNHTENTKFLYGLLEEKELLSKIAQFKIEPNIGVYGKASLLRIDFYFLFNINNTAIPVYLEIDDCGHSAFDRKVSDILKDVCCLTYGVSLVRVRPNENIFGIIKELISSRKQKFYRFYDDYFNNKKHIDIENTKKQKYIKKIEKQY